MTRRLKYRLVRKYGTVREGRIKNIYEFNAYDPSFPVQYLSGGSLWTVVDAIVEQIMEIEQKAIEDSME